ncbi:MAG: hypothetical protein KatS3mg002_1668 [Candidatus Woesearchaeota archaeon]|nr:MAG: hypothetical protein KatS3mg002_1668 [Candidatus Woesearchaeota archaeon]
MKIHYSIITVLLLFTNSYTQNIDSLFRAAEQISCGLFTKEVEWKIVQPIKGDIVNYFSLGYRYDTPLKRKKFYETKESWVLADSLKKVKKIVLNKWWKTEVENISVAYDLKKEALTIGGIDACYASTINNNMADFAGVYFPMLNKMIEVASLGILQKMHLHLRISEDDALDIENNSDNLKIFLLFKVKDDLFKKTLTMVTGFDEWVEMPIAENCYILFINTNDNTILKGYKIK